MVISSLNLKGGSGKSTIAINLSVGFALKGKKVLLVDTDEQKTCQRWSGVRNSENVFITVVSITDPGALKKQIKQLEKDFEIVIIDGAPQIDQITSISISVSDIILIPVSPSPHDLWSTENVIAKIDNAMEINDELKAFFVLNRYSPRTLLSKSANEALETLEIPVLESKLNNRIAYAEAPVNGLSVLEWSDPLAKKEAEDLLLELETKL